MTVDEALTSAAIQVGRSIMAGFATPMETRTEIIVTLAAEVSRLRAALQNIVEAHHACSELYTSHEDCAAGLADRARKALGETP